jgi:hypothetical protein
MSITIKEITKSKKRLIVEISMYDFKKYDFYYLWDEVREKYDDDKYKLDKIELETYRVIIEFKIKDTK